MAGHGILVPVCDPGRCSFESQVSKIEQSTLRTFAKVWRMDPEYLLILLNRNQLAPLIRFHGNGNGLQIFWDLVHSE